jgi:competence protein ComFC
MLLDKLLNLIVPASCYACKIRIDSQDMCLCDQCHSRLKRQDRLLIGEVSIDDIQYDDAMSLYQYDFMTRELVHLYKFGGIKKLGKFFSAKATDILKSEHTNFIKDLDGAIGIPMTRVAEQNRGFNHSFLMCHYISAGLGITDYSKYLMKKGISRHQSRLSKRERLENKSHQNYSIRGVSPFHGKNILIVDDVFTTGVTVNEISRFLRKNSVNSIKALVIASGNA